MRLSARAPRDAERRVGRRRCDMIGCPASGEEGTGERPGHAAGRGPRHVQAAQRRTGGTLRRTYVSAVRALRSLLTRLGVLGMFDRWAARSRTGLWMRSLLAIYDLEDLR